MNKRPGLTELQRRAGAIALALAPAVWVSTKLIGKTPLSYDHATHLFKAWHFWEEMLGNGRLRGWSHFWAFGSPSDELVPFGSGAWVGLFRALTFGQLSWLATYSLAFAALMLFKSYAAYLFTEKLLGKSTAIVCAWITLFDPGGMLEGGWSWHTHWGVWPVTLAMSFALLSLRRLEMLLTDGSTRNVLWTGLWLAASLLTHQMGILVFAVAAPILLVDGWLRPAPLRLEAFAKGLGGLMLGFCLSGFFMIPFLVRTQHTQDLGWLGEGLDVVSQHVVGFQVFQNVWPPVHAFALLGAWLVLRNKSRAGVFLVGCGGVFVLLASGTIIRDLHLERVLPTLLKIESNRMLLVAKLFWFPLAAYGAVTLVRMPLSQGLLARPVKRWAVRLVLGAVALALLLPGRKEFYKTQIEKSFISQENRDFYADFVPLLQWTKRERESNQDHYRIAYKMWRGEHLSTLAPVYDGTLMYKIGYTPTQIFNKMPMTDETELLEALSVKYVVSSNPITFPTMKFVRRFGRLHLYRFLNYRADPFLMSGAGEGKLLEFSPDKVRIALHGTEANSRIRLHIASFDRWEATLNGSPLPIDTVAVLGNEYPLLMEVPASDGELVLEYVYRSADWVGLLLTLFSLPAFGAIWWLNRKTDLLTRGLATIARAQKPLLGVIVGGSLLFAVSVAWATRSRTRLLPSGSVFHSLYKQGEMSLGGKPCLHFSALSYHCGPHRVQAAPVSGAWGVHRCMSAPTNAGPLKIQTTVKLGQFITGHYDPAKKGAGRIEVKVDGISLGTIKTRPAHLRQQQIQFDARELAGKEVQLEVIAHGAALHCFDVNTAN